MQGVSSDYSAVIEHLSASQMKADGMKRWLHALQLCVSQLGREYDQLVSATLVCATVLVMCANGCVAVKPTSFLQRFSWFNQPPDLIDLYIEYLTNLISAQTCYLRSVLLGLVCQLWQPHPDLEGDTVYRNIHRAIKAVLELVPTAPTLLATLLSKHFPFKGKGPEVQVSCDRHN